MEHGRGNFKYVVSENEDELKMHPRLYCLMKNSFIVEYSKSKNLKP